MLSGTIQAAIRNAPVPDVHSATDLVCVRGDWRLFVGVGFTLETGRRLHVTGENGSGGEQGGILGSIFNGKD